MKIIALKIGPFVFSPHILPFMAGLFLIALFTGLGRWQIDRMHESQSIEDQRLSNAQQPLQSLPKTMGEPQEWRYAPISVNGVWMSDQQFLLDNQVRNQKAGYSVLTPFRLDDGRTVLIDRGWVPLVDGARDNLPSVALTSNNPQKISGHLYSPFEATTINQKYFQARGWPAVISDMDFKFIGSLLGVTVEPFAVRMNADQEHGYLRQWPLPPFSPSKHLGYAVQWFALALALLVIMVALNTKRR